MLEPRDSLQLSEFPLVLNLDECLLRWRQLLGAEVLCAGASPVGGRVDTECIGPRGLGEP